MGGAGPRGRGGPGRGAEGGRGPRRVLESPALLAASALLFAWFVARVLPAEAAKAALSTPEGGAFDTSFFYTPAAALDRAASYSAEGRFAYIAARWSFDLAWPLVYGLFTLSAWAFALARLGRAGLGRLGLGRGAPVPAGEGAAAGGAAREAGSRGSPGPRLAGLGLLWIPLLGPVLDFAENISVTVLMASVPARPLGWAVAASAATLSKWLFVLAGTGGALVLPAAAMLGAARGAARRR